MCGRPIKNDREELVGGLRSGSIFGRHGSKKTYLNKGSWARLTMTPIIETTCAWGKERTPGGWCMLVEGWSAVRKVGRLADRGEAVAKELEWECRVYCRLVWDVRVSKLPKLNKSWDLSWAPSSKWTSLALVHRDYCTHSCTTVQRTCTEWLAVPNIS